MVIFQQAIMPVKIYFNFPFMYMAGLESLLCTPGQKVKQEKKIQAWPCEPLWQVQALNWTRQLKTFKIYGIYTCLILINNIFFFQVLPSVIMWQLPGISDLCKSFGICRNSILISLLPRIRRKKVFPCPMFIICPLSLSLYTHMHLSV